MPLYETSVPHAHGRAEAVTRLQIYMEHARAFADLDVSWTGDDARFSTSVQGIRVSGRLRVEEDSLQLAVQLPLIAYPFAGWLSKILRVALREGGELSRGRMAEHADEPDERTRGAADESRSDPIVLYLHVPKAGGTTLGEYVFNQCRTIGGRDEGLMHSGVLFLPYGFIKEPSLAIPAYVFPLLARADLRAVIGHFWFGLHACVGRPAQYITLLRDPVERTLSLYHYLHADGQVTLDDFVVTPALKEVDNDQTRRIAGVDPGIGECTEEILRVAKNNLREHFTVVGVTERFEETLALLRRKLAWSRAVQSFPRNVNDRRPKREAIPRATLDAIRNRNALDLELYAFANHLMDVTTA